MNGREILERLADNPHLRIEVGYPVYVLENMRIERTTVFALRDAGFIEGDFPYYRLTESGARAASGIGCFFDAETGEVIK